MPDIPCESAEEADDRGHEHRYRLQHRRRHVGVIASGHRGGEQGERQKRKQGERRIEPVRRLDLELLLPDVPLLEQGGQQARARGLLHRGGGSCLLLLVGAAFGGVVAGRPQPVVRDESQVDLAVRGGVAVREAGEDAPRRQRSQHHARDHLLHQAALAVVGGQRRQHLERQERACWQQVGDLGGCVHSRRHSYEMVAKWVQKRLLQATDLPADSEHTYLNLPATQ